MSFGKINNLDVVEHIWGGVTIAASSYYTCQSPSEALRFASDDNLVTAISSSLASVDTGSTVITSSSAAIEYLLGLSVNITSQPPFAEPLYRTKRAATSSIATCNVNSSANIDFQLTAERYVVGGCMIIKNAEFGDYVTAEVHDTDGVIPAPYRTALCEAHPTVAKYVEKEFVEFLGQTYTVHTINTAPLSAKISAGLYLRVTYYAVNSGSAREIGINYQLNKKL